MVDVFLTITLIDTIGCLCAVPVLIDHVIGCLCLFLQDADQIQWRRHVADIPKIAIQSWHFDKVAV